MIWSAAEDSMVLIITMLLYVLVLGNLYDVYRTINILFQSNVEYITSKTFAKIRLLGELNYVLDRET